ncbi:MAG: hypothetical protein H6845_01085 [Alphaproteobacteria bacterium]|nr:MAG: hypothetical protein H6845_01085 [Alphaproteobacteria bacterium]
MLQNDLFLTFLIGIVSAAAFLLLSKVYGLLPHIVEFIKKIILFLSNKVTFLFGNLNKVMNKDLNKSFEENMHFLYSHFQTDDFKYKLPFILFLGIEKSGKTELINSLKLDTLVSDKDDKNKLCSWYFFTEAVLLEVNSAIFSDKTMDLSGTNYEWYKLLDLFSYHRPERPIDSIVLTISIAQLYEENENLSEIAEHYYVKLVQIQKRFGVNVPIYVAFTYSDYIPGFADFTKVLSFEVQSKIFGWSNPHMSSTIDSDSIINDAFEGIVNRIWAIQHEIMVNEDLSEAGVFSFPIEFNKLKRKIVDLLFYIFRYSEINDNFVFRGFYFTGSATNNLYSNYEFKEILRSVEFGQLTKHAQISESNLICFFNDLFVKKILKEKGLTIPLSSNIFNNSRKVRLIQYLVLVVMCGGVINLGYHYLTIKNVSSSMTAELSKIRVAVYNAKLLYDGVYDELDHKIFETQALALINAIKNIKPNSQLLYYSLPPSWFSGARYDVKLLLAHAYDFVIFKFIKNKIKSDVDVLLTSNVGECRTDNFVSVVNSQKFCQLRHYIEEITKLEQVQLQLNRVSYLYNIYDLNLITEKLFNMSITDLLLQNKHVFQDIMKLSDVHVQSLDIHKTQVIRKVEDLFAQFVNHALVYDNIIPYISYIEKALLLLEKGEYQNVEVLSGYINQLATFVHSNEINWFFNDPHSLGEKLNELLYRVQDSYILGTNMARYMKQEIEKKVHYLRQKLITHSLPILGVIFAKTGSGSIIFSSSFNEFQGIINFLYSKDFMKDLGYSESDKLSSELLKWDVTKLANAMNIIKSFNQFNDDMVLYKDQKTKKMLTNIASISVVKQVTSLVIDSQTDLTDLVSEEQVLLDVSTNFYNATLNLINILNFLKVANYNFFTELKDVILKQIMSYLSKLDLILNERQLYDIAHSAFFIGKSNNIDKEGLKIYINRQREQIFYLVGIAKPFIEFLNKIEHMDKSMTNKTYIKWKKIVSNTKKYEEGKENSLQLLEKLIEDLTVAKNVECFSKSNEVDVNDYFENITNKVMNVIHEKLCREQYTNLRNNYKSFMDYFDQYIKNKFPFNKHSTIDISIVEAKKMVALWKKINLNEQAVKVIEKHNDITFLHFIKKMNKLMPWIEAMYDDSKSISAVITMRTNRDKEHLADHLSVCQLQVGDQIISQNESKEVKIGDTKLRLTLNLSKETPYHFHDGKTYEFNASGFFNVMRLYNKFQVSDDKLKIIVPVCKGNLIVWADIIFSGNILKSDCI